MKNYKNTYTPSQQMMFTKCGCDAVASPPGWLLDKIAEEKLLGGYNTKKSNLCEGCFTYRSTNGECNCT